MILQPPRLASAEGKYSFVNARTGERVTAETLDELRRKGAAILAELGLDQDPDPRSALLQELGAPSLLRSCPSPAARVIDADLRPRPLAGARLIAPRP
jgi:hypothetical protein